MNFFEKLISADSPESSKRFSMLVSLGAILVIALFAMFFTIKSEGVVLKTIDILGLIVGGTAIATAAEKFSSVKKDI